MSDSDDDRDVSKLAREVIAELEPGTIIDNRVILSRRQAVGLATGAISLGALSGFGASSAQAEDVAGQVGTETEPIGVYAGHLNDGGVLSEGDGVERRLWVIAEGAGDPDDASAEDLIFEEES